MRAGNLKINDSTVLYIAIPIVGIIAYLLWRFNSTLKSGSNLLSSVADVGTGAVQSIGSLASVTASATKSTASAIASGYDNLLFSGSQLQLENPSNLSPVLTQTPTKDMVINNNSDNGIPAMNLSNSGNYGLAGLYFASDVSLANLEE